MRLCKAVKPGWLPMVCCLLALLLVIGGNGVAFGASYTTMAKAPPSQQIYRYGDVVSDISTFDPAVATDAPSIEAITMVFTGLVQLDNHLQVQPQLAQSYTASSDRLSYTFHLRPHLRFSDGTPLTASDVAYSIDRALSPAIANISGVTQTYLGLIKGAQERIHGTIPTVIGDGVKVLNSQTVQINISAPASYFLQALTYPTSYVVEKSVIDKWGSKWTEHLSDNDGQGGNGPFKVRSYNHSIGIVFVPNPNYYGPQPQLQRVDFNFYKLPETAYEAYLAGQLDIMKAVPAGKVAQASALPHHQYIRVPALTIDYLAMNYLYKPFDNIHIRQAFDLAINKDIIAKDIFKGTRTATCHIVPDGMPGYNPHLQCPAGAATRGNAKLARKLFQQGLREEHLTLATLPPIKITSQSNAPDLTNAITTMRQAWREILGVNVQSEVIDFVQMLQAEAQTLCTQSNPAKCLNQGLQMWAAAWGADYPDPQDWISLQFGVGAPNNQANYGQNVSTSAAAQQAVQRAMPKADIEPNQHTRMTMYHQLEQKLVNDVAWMSYDQRATSTVLKPYVVGQTFNPLGLVPPNDWGKIYIAAL